MLRELEQMLELGKALLEAAEAGDVDKVVALLKRRKELTDQMGPIDPNDPDVASGKVAQVLGEIVRLDGEIETKMRALMSTLQKAIAAVQGEQSIVKGYLRQTDAGEPRFLDKEG